MSNNDYIYYENRIKELRKKLNKKNIPATILLKDEDIFYFTGFYGKNSTSILFISQNEIYLLVNFIFFEQAKKDIYMSAVQIIKYKKERFEELSELLGDSKVKFATIEGEKISYFEFMSLQRILKKHGKNLISVEDLTAELRQIKDELEIRNLKKACRITDIAFKWQLTNDQDYFLNISEREHALNIEKIMVRNNSSGKSFDFVIASNDKSSMPHYQSSDNKIRKGLLLTDYGCSYKNYCSDITRAFFLGKTNILNEFKEIYDIVLQAQLLAVEHCRAGITAENLDKIARDYIVKSGYGENFGHSLGHGVGLEIHELPYIKSGNHDTLKENMIITIEPGIYIPGKGGVRIEDMVIVKKNCCEVLYSSEKKLIVI